MVSAIPPETIKQGQTMRRKLRRRSSRPRALLVISSVLFLSFHGYAFRIGRSSSLLPTRRWWKSSGNTDGGEVQRRDCDRIRTRRKKTFRKALQDLFSIPNSFVSLFVKGCHSLFCQPRNLYSNSLPGFIATRFLRGGEDDINDGKQNNTNDEIVYDDEKNENSSYDSSQEVSPPDDDVVNNERLQHGDDGIINPFSSTELPLTSSSSYTIPKRRKYRHTSDIILELDQRSSVYGNDQSLALRQLISSRTIDYTTELEHSIQTMLQQQQQQQQHGLEDGGKVKLQHPRKLLHYLAPKVPAIKHSPDVNLRIHSSQSDIDPGIAACILGRLAHVCELYDGAHQQRQQQLRREDGGRSPPIVLSSAALDLIKDRRFEQLVECVISGVNVKQRMEEYQGQRLETSTEKVATDIEELLDEEHAQIDEGLNIRDACRAAWGIAVLGAHRMDSLGGVKVQDLLLALSLRIRELLLARLQLLRRDDILFLDDNRAADVDNNNQNEENDTSFLAERTTTTTTEERLNELSEELAEDAASAMWAFACVRACTGMRSVPLFETCCSILCQDPVDLRRRAQEAEGDNPTIGNNDVVDRLARSEAAAVEEETSHESPDGGGVGGGDNKTPTTKRESDHDSAVDEKGAFLDWLSPTEINDVLWALALHGSHGASSNDEVVLSETAAALRETAYDRMVEWLEEDLSRPPTTAEPDYEEESTNNSYELTNVSNGTVTFEVVDAAALLASEAAASSLSSSKNFVNKQHILHAENVAVRTKVKVGVDGDIHHQVEHVIEDERNHHLTSTHSTQEEMVEMNTEVMISSSSSMIETNEMVGSEEAEMWDNIGSNSLEKRWKKVATTQPGTRPIFSPNDLASIAWSVTELRDPLKTHIVRAAIELLYRLGSDAMSVLSGTDLSNLAWAVARYGANDKNTQVVAITKWIVEEVLQRTQNCALLSIFQPPEVGRIMWSIAYTVSHVQADFDEFSRRINMPSLAREALEVAATDLSIYATEDLVRIAWAFLEIADSGRLVQIDSAVATCLGKLLATTELSLHRWERGDSIASDSTTTSSAYDTDGLPSLFSSFFGKSRINLSLLEHDVGDHYDDDDDILALAPLLERTQRPKLKDLAVDPSSLCKAACSFQKLCTAHPHIEGGWTITRVAIRLLSSKDARLMKECSIHDIVRLCEAAVLSEVDGHGRELIVGLFARHLVKLLNDGLVQSETTTDDLPAMDLSSLSSKERCTLIWALGEMGVKCSPSLADVQSATKKLRLAPIAPLLKDCDVDSLDLPTLRNLLHGLVLSKAVSGNHSFVLRVLTRTNDLLGVSTSENDLCNLVESAAILKESLMVRTSSHPDPKRTPEAEPKESNDETESKSESHVVDLHDGRSIDTELSKMTDQLLLSIGTLALDATPRLTAKQLRRLLTVYSLLPFQSDDLVATMEAEVYRRLKALEDVSSRRLTLEGLLRDAEAKSKHVEATLFEDSNESLFGSIRAGIMSWFRPGHNSEESKADEEGTVMAKEIASIIQDSISATSAVVKRTQDDQDTLRMSLDGTMESAKDGVSFELGRCKVLIDNYRRIEFSTGTRRSRYDKDRRNEIAKRVLSRLLP